jgi:hypothetical protein
VSQLTVATGRNTQSISLSAPKLVNSSGSARPPIPSATSSFHRKYYLEKYLDYGLRELVTGGCVGLVSVTRPLSHKSKYSISLPTLLISLVLMDSSSSSESVVLVDAMDSSSSISNSESDSCSGGECDSVVILLRSWEEDWKLGGGLGKSVSVTVAGTFVTLVAAAQYMLCVECWSPTNCGDKRGA